ncbi:MAG: hypothetical protein KJ624_04735 [Chloroflexi bacterium]|nr:hypothetical protein [Chloroflexota bacterium]
MKAKRTVTIVTLCASGHRSRTAELGALTEAEMFGMPYSVAVNGTVVRNWEEFLSECQHAEDLKVLRFPQVEGGACSRD